MRSSVEIVTPAPSYGLTEVSTIKTALGITDSLQDARLYGIIRAVSDLVCTYCGRAFALEEVKESVGATGLPDLLLSRTPIKEITSVSFDNGPFTDWTILDREAGIVQATSGWASTEYNWTNIDLAPAPYTRYLWEFTYKGGYVLPGWPSPFARNLPYDLEMAVIDMVKAQYFLGSNVAFGGSGAAGVTKYKIGETEIDFDTSGTTGSSAGTTATGSAMPGISAMANGILSYYRRSKW
jgi:hypothetical protein